MRKSRYLHLLLLLFTFLLPAATAFAQDDNSGDVIDKIISFPDKIFNRIDKEANKAEQHIIGSTEKYLNKLEKQELKLKRKLWKTDSTKAKEVFGDVKGRYNALRNCLKNKEAAIQQQSNTYIGHIDSLNTAMKFISNNPQLQQGTAAVQRLSTNLESVTNLQNRFNQTELIRKQIQQRQQYLKSQLQNTGLVKEFRKYRQKIYYMQQEARSYKEALSDPDKFGKKLLETAMKFPAFQNFFREHSELASLFALPGGTSPTGGSMVAPGLQTRADVQQQLMNQFGAQTFTAPAGGGASPFQQQIQAAQGEMQKLKDKVSNSSSFGGGGEEVEMPDFRTNPEKTKTFKNRLQPNINFQTTKGSRYFPVATEVAVGTGFKINPKSVIGVSLSYRMGWGQGWENIRLTHQSAGMRTYLDWKIKGSFWISGGGEMIYNTQFRRVEELKEYSAWNPSALLGISKVIDVKSKFFKKTKISVMHDFLWKKNPAGQRIVFRVGYNIR